MKFAICMKNKITKAMMNIHSRKVSASPFIVLDVRAILSYVQIRAKITTFVVQKTHLSLA